MEWSFPHISMKDMRSKVTDKKKIEKEDEKVENYTKKWWEKEFKGKKSICECHCSPAHKNRFQFLSFHIKWGNWNFCNILIPLQSVNKLLFACLLFIKYSNNEEIVTSFPSYSHFCCWMRNFSMLERSSFNSQPQRGKAEAKVSTSLDLWELRWENYEKSLHNSEVF